MPGCVKPTTISRWLIWPKTTVFWPRVATPPLKPLKWGLKGALLELGIEPPHTHVLNELVQRLGDNGLNTDQLKALPLRGLSRMAIQSRYPLDATPPSDLFDPTDAEQALATAADVLNILEALDQQG